jgi:hypothetical protein
MKLQRLQNLVFGLIHNRGAAGEKLIKPNARLSAAERLDIYSESYWARIVDSFSEDFPALRKLMGAPRFSRLANDYLRARPSKSWTLRDLGSRLVPWMVSRKFPRLLVDMARLEWAHIEAFDGPSKPPLRELRNLRKLHLQPYVQLLELGYEVDKLYFGKASRRPRKVYLAVHRYEGEVCFKRLDPLAFALLVNLRKGLPLEDAIPAKANPTQVRDWFANFAQLGWFAAR